MRQVVQADGQDTAATLQGAVASKPVLDMLRDSIVTQKSLKKLGADYINILRSYRSHPNVKARPHLGISFVFPLGLQARSKTEVRQMVFSFYLG